MPSEVMATPSREIMEPSTRLMGSAGSDAWRNQDRRHPFRHTKTSGNLPNHKLGRTIVLGCTGELFSHPAAGSYYYLVMPALLDVGMC